ncbi:LacI family DNA-binding transcriptional regulator [Streptomyces sp. Qhu-G9]|uniref:LacI family DNA-binding transcriptional regulator n=1 Tax=Streptomyces sp. Qhu-G9 TaxID=3452799 RepID=UPI0022ABF589|nr:LacI family DNA-binding transcriptional regulator [Streptomyces aurantiacus]WAU86237.1 LacI family DNA-binding transcriptional regulator [Streptomyces aurantiacus]
MSDVAAKAGVSRALVSIVFRGRPGAGQETRDRVLRVADEIGYRPDSAARLLARGRSRTLGVVLTVHQTFQADLVEGIYPEAERLGYDVLLSAHAPGRDEGKVVEALLSHRCEALILLGPASDPDRLDALGHRTVAVSVGRHLPGVHVDSVHTAETKGVRQAIGHLVELGHRRIAHVDGGRDPGSAERRRAYRAAMRRHGLAEEIRVIPGAHTEQAGVEAGRLLIAEAERSGRTALPTAILAGNDRCAMGLLITFARAGVEVPDEVSVVGYDDSHLSHLMPIGLTTVRQDAALMAEYAVRFAVERLENPNLGPREAVLDPKLVVRGSSGVPRVG